MVGISEVTVLEMPTLVDPRCKVKNFFDNFGSWAPIDDLFSAASVWIEPGSSSISGRYRGPESIFKLCKEILARSQGTFRIVEVIEIVAGERYVLAVIDVEGSCEGRLIRTRDTIVFQFEDNKAIEVKVYSEDQSAVDAFWD